MKRNRRLLIALLVAALLAIPAIARADAFDDIMRAFCAGIGEDHPLYGPLDCARLLQPSPQG